MTGPTRTLRARRRRRRAAAAAVPKPNTWYGLVVLVAVLVTVGLVMVLSASSVQSQRDTGSTFSYFIRQAIWTLLGTIVLVVVSRIDYRTWRRFVPVLLPLSFSLLVVVLVPGVGREVNGARSWISFGGPLNFQPSELVKLALLLFSADVLARRSKQMGDWRQTMVPVLTIVGIAATLMMLQPDLGSTMVMGAIVFSVLFVAGAPLVPLASVFGGSAVAATALALAKTYRRNRLLAFLHPSADPGNTAYQINQSLNGVASGRFFGVGLGQSRAKWGFLPNAHTDFIFAIIAEELGLVGAFLVLVLFVAFGVFGIRAALRAPDRFGMFLAAGVTAWLLAQAFVNVGGVVGVLPITGLTLPFISFGGTSIVVTMAATGLLLNVAANGRSDARPKGRPVAEGHPSRRVPVGSR